MSPSSKPMRTFSNSTGAYAVSRLASELMPANPMGNARQGDVRYTSDAAASLCRGCALEKFVAEIQGQFGEKDVRADDHNVRDHHRLRSSSPDALGSTAHCQPFVAAHRGQDETVDQRLHHALHKVRKLQRIDGPRPELHCT